MKADQAVVWLTPVSGSNGQEEHAEFELMGHVEVRQPGVVRTVDHLWVPVAVLSNVHIVATSGQRVRADHESDSPLYKKPARYAALRRRNPPREPFPQRRLRVRHITRPAAQLGRHRNRPNPARGAVHIEATHLETTDTEEGNVAFVASGGITIRIEQNGDVIEMQAQRSSALHSFAEPEGYGRESQDRSRDAESDGGLPRR